MSDFLNLNKEIEMLAEAFYAQAEFDEGSEASRRQVDAWLVFAMASLTTDKSGAF